MSRIILLLSLVTVAFAEGAAGSAPATAPAGSGGDGTQGTQGGQEVVQPGGGPGNWIFIGFFVLIGFMLWSSFRQSKKEKQKLQDLISNLKLGDKVETIGGLRGKVARLGEGEVDIITGNDSSITIAAGAVKQVITDEKPGDQK